MVKLAYHRRKSTLALAAAALVIGGTDLSTAALIPLNGASANITGKVAGVDRGRRRIDVRGTNGIVYHVDMGGARLLVDDQAASIDSIQNGAWAQVTSSSLETRSNTLEAVQVRIMDDNYRGRGQGVGLPYAGNLRGRLISVDRRRQRFDFKAQDGRTYRVESQNAAIFVEGERLAFDDMPTTGFVQVVPTRQDGNTIWASEIRAAITEADAYRGNNSNGYGTPGYGTPGYGTPTYGTPGYGTPGNGTPGYGTPTYGTPGYGTPTYGTRGYGDDGTDKRTKHNRHRGQDNRTPPPPPGTNGYGQVGTPNTLPPPPPGSGSYGQDGTPNTPPPPPPGR